MKSADEIRQLINDGVPPSDWGEEERDTWFECKWERCMDAAEFVTEYLLAAGHVVEQYLIWIECVGPAETVIKSDAVQDAIAAYPKAIEAFLQNDVEIIGKTVRGDHAIEVTVHELPYIEFLDWYETYYGANTND